MFNHARTRLGAGALLAGAGLLACSQPASAQTGPALLVAPFPKEQFVDTQGSWLYGDAGHVKGTDESVRVSVYELAGRVRIQPGSLISPRVGWELEYVDIDAGRSDGFGDFAALPGQLTDQSVGVATPVAKVDEWVFGVAVGVGYAGASPFGEGSAWYGKATALAFRQFSENDALVFVIDYDGNRTFLPDVPLPGVAYTRRVSPNLFYVVGIPLSSVTWKPFKNFSLEAGWYPVESFNAAAGYALTPYLSAFASLDHHSSAFTLDELDDGNDRLIFQQRRAELGLRWAPRRGRQAVAFTAAAGYAWGQEFSVGYDSRNTDEVADVSDEPYARVGFEVKF